MPDRLPLLGALAALLLAGCGGPDRPAKDLYADYLAAVEARDADAAYTFLDQAADAGHLGAMAEQIEAHRRGYVRPPGADTRNLHVRTPMWRLSRLERRYERAVRDSAAAGSPMGLLHAAQRLTGDLVTTNGEMQSALDPADRDSVEALYRQLVATDVSNFQVALVAWHLGHDDDALRHLDEAVAAAEPHACTFRLVLSGRLDTRSDAAGYAAFLDRVEACPTSPGTEGWGARSVRALLAERDRGNPASVALLDSLHQTGVFERHPRLRAIVAEAG